MWSEQIFSSGNGPQCRPNHPWHDIIVNAIQMGFSTSSQSIFGASLIDWDNIAPKEELRAMGADPLYGATLLAIDSYFDARSHNFPDMGEGISIESGEDLMRQILAAADKDTFRPPDEVQRYMKFLPFRA